MSSLLGERGDQLRFKGMVLIAGSLNGGSDHRCDSRIGSMATSASLSVSPHKGRGRRCWMRPAPMNALQAITAISPANSSGSFGGRQSARRLHDDPEHLHDMLAGIARGEVMLMACLTTLLHPQFPAFPNP